MINAKTSAELAKVRELSIPAERIKVTCKVTGAVAYFYRTKTGEPAASFFRAKATKPSFSYQFKTMALATAYVKRYFATVIAAKQSVEHQKAEAAAKAAEVGAELRIGSLFKAAWGYEQTNIQYYEVIAKTEKTVTVQEIITTGYMSGKCVPLPGLFRKGSKAKVCRPNAYGSIKLDSYKTAYLVQPKIVGGFPVYEWTGWTAYA